MKRALAITAVAAVATLVALATLVGSARATYPGATNGSIAFGMNVGGDVDVYTALPNGQDLRRLTDDAHFDACAAYSADGQRIAYCSGQSGGPVQVWTMKQNGTDKQQVTHMSGPAIFPDFSPDGSEIVFNSNRTGTGTGTSQVYVMNADGSGQVQLTLDSAPKDQVSDWSPDGSKIAYLADTHGISDVVNPSWGDIWVMNADGSGQHAITSGASWYGTAWSPDGTSIATLDLPSRTVYTLNASDGSDAQAVHAGPGPQFVPGWQPRGTGEGDDIG